MMKITLLTGIDVYGNKFHVDEADYKNASKIQIPLRASTGLRFSHMVIRKPCCTIHRENIGRIVSSKNVEVQQ